MSSLSGDECEVAENEPVRRTRSGRAVKAPTVKKTPVKKPATRASRRVQQVEEVEEEAVFGEAELIEQLETIPENGMQQITELQTSEEKMSSDLNIQLEDPDNVSHDADSRQSIHHDVEDMSELEAFADNTSQQSNPIQIKVREGSELIMNEGKDTSDPLAMFDTTDIHLVEGDQVSNEATNMESISTTQHSEVIEFEELPSEQSSTQADRDFFQEELLEESSLQSGGNQAESTAGETVGIEMMEVDETENDAIIGNVEEIHTIYKKYAAQVVVRETSETSSEEKKEEITEDELKKTEPDTEAVSEDELPNETATKEPETEAVSDEELPVTATADLGETESVSEDELPPDSEKKRKIGKSLSKTPEKKPKVNGGGKRKLNAEGEYDPSSPTSENNDETPAKKSAISTGADGDDPKSDAKPASPKKKTLPELEKYWKAVNEDPADFTGWTYLLQYVDQENDAEAAREAYSKFLQRYPYCYGYWRKYADYEKKKGDPENVQTDAHVPRRGEQDSLAEERRRRPLDQNGTLPHYKVFDQGLKAISLSVDLWLHYINHCKTIYEKDEEKMREQYERAISACGLEFRSDRLWESYIKWETEGKRLNRVLNLYDRLLTTPTLGYISHFEAFQEFVQSNAPNRILSVDDFLTLRSEVKALLKADDAANSVADDAPPGEELPPHETPPTDEETRAIREKIISSRRKMHKANVNSVAARWSYEEGIKRPYFHVKPLERCQLKNWKEYLDFEIEQKDQNRIIILFERCLIACALYDEFWLRFIRYLESLKGDFSEKIRDVYTRACTIHHPKKPNLHLQWATFEESQGNFAVAASILENIDSLLPNMLQIAYRRINLERRRGDLDKACSLYESYISNSKNRTIANNIAVKYARFLCKIKNDIDKAIKVLMKATEKDKDNPRLYLQLIDLGLQRTPVDTQEIVGYMDMFIDREHADLEQRVLFAQRKVEFLEDFSPDIRQVLKAHEQFQKCIKQAKERKKTKNEDGKVDVTPPKKAKTSDTSSAPPPPSMGSQSSYQYGSGPSGPYQSQQQFQGSQYGSQGGYQQGYQQYPPPSDPNYANYQNWQYGQGGPQAYGPYNQWGSYNYY